MTLTVFICGHQAWIGSYPGERHVTCYLPAGHHDQHEGHVWWDHAYPECDDAKSPEEQAS